MKLQHCLDDGYVRIGNRFLVHKSPPGLDWLLAYNLPGGDKVVLVDIRNPGIVSQVYDMAVRSYDSLVIDQDYDPVELNEMIAELSGGNTLSNINAWLATCWLSAKIQGNPNRGSIKLKKSLSMEEMRRKVESIYGKNIHEELEDPENKVIRYNGFVTMREFTRQLMKLRDGH